MPQAWIPALPEDVAPGLSERGVHVWSATWTPGGRLDGWEALLSDDERERAWRLRMPAHRHRFIAMRGLLRRLLAAYLCGIDPACIAFACSARGKPALAAPRSGLHFNLSHAGDRLVVALSRGGEVGVDVEQLDAAVEPAQLLSNVMGTSEQHDWWGLPEAERRAAFFRCWVRKEAWLKAQGLGLGDGMAQRTVGVRPLPSGGWRPPGDAGIVLWDGLPMPGAVAALAVCGPCEQPHWLVLS